MPTTDADHLDREAVARLVSGDDRALDELMDRHAEPIYRFLYRMLANEDDAEDLAQEVFVRLYRSCASYRPKHRFRTWLYTIAANLGRNKLRWRSRHLEVSTDDTTQSEVQSPPETFVYKENSPEDELQTSERNKAVRDAVAGLPESLREAVVLREWEELSLTDAASILNATPKAVESRLYRARRLLREQLIDWL